VKEKNHQVECAVCKKRFPISGIRPGRFVRPAVSTLISAAFPESSSEGSTCNQDLSHFRSQYVLNVLTEQKGQLTELEKEGMTIV